MTSQMIGDKVVSNIQCSSVLPSGGYFHLIWPKGLPAKELKMVRALCDFNMRNAIQWAEESADEKSKDVATRWAEKLWADWTVE